MKRTLSRLAGIFVSANLFFPGCAGFFPEMENYSKNPPKIFITLNGDDYFLMEEKTNHLFWALIRRIEEVENRNLTRKELSTILGNLDLMDKNKDSNIEMGSVETAYKNMLKNMNENNHFKKYFNPSQENLKVELGPHQGVSPKEE